jgi:hypothetical protein
MLAIVRLPQHTLLRGLSQPSHCCRQTLNQAPEAPTQERRRIMTPQKYSLWTNSEAFGQIFEAVSINIEDGVLVARDDTGIVFATKMWETVRKEQPQQKDS